MPDRLSTETRTSTLRQRLQYRLDNLLTRGTWAALLVLGAVVLLAVLVSAVLLSLFSVSFSGSEDASVLEDLWQSTLRVIDAGTMAGDIGWGRRLLALLVTVFGILVAGTLIGVIASGVEQHVERMQRGRGTVLESGHVVVLGASDRIPIVVGQLTMANRKRRGNAIVVLTPEDPVKMSEEVRSVVTDARGCRLVFRQGDPTRRLDLAMVSVHRARAVVVLADADANGDARVVKTVLAVGAEVGGFDRIPIVAELTGASAAESLSRACGGQVSPVVASDAIAAIVAASITEPGLARVVEELLSFDGADLHVRPLGDLAGAPFGESVFRFSKARPIGRIKPGGEVEINPAPETVLEPGDRLVVLADDDGADLARNTAVDGFSRPTGTQPRRKTHRRELRIMIVGWNALGRGLIEQIEGHAASGSSIEVVYDPKLVEPDEIDIPASTEVTVRLAPVTADTRDRFSSREMAEFDTIILLGYRRGMSVAEADSRTLLTMMLLKRGMQSLGSATPRIITELLDAESVDLAYLTGADDYIVSDAITSRLMTQIADRPWRGDALRALYGPHGPSIRLVEVRELGLAGKHTWNEIVAVAYSLGLLAIGWRLASPQGADPVLNPAGGEGLLLDNADNLIVIGGGHGSR